MRLNRKHMAACTAVMMAVSAVTGITAMAGSDKAFSIDMTDRSENSWAGIAMANDDMVSTGANIRTTAGEDGAVVGFLYRGGAVNVLDKGEEWTEVQSGSVTGYIKNEYLTYGDEAKGLADYYGVDGVEASWNDVNVFSGADANADIIHTANDGEAFPVVEDSGHWLSVQLGADHMAYVSEEDVARVILVDTAVPLEGGTSDTAYTEDTYTEEPSYEDTYTEDTYSEDTSYNDNYTEEPSYDDSYTEEPAYEDTYTEDTYTEEPAYEDTYTEEPSYEDTYTEEPSYEDTYTEEPSYDDSYTDDTYTDDGSSEGAEEYVDDSVEYTEETSTPEEYIQETEAYVEETEAAPSTGSSSDLDLLAAIIYCEAGNQGYDGMVAVGAVVMNRVASSSFPGTVSDVIYQSGQFTPASSGALSSALASGVPSSCYDAASAALAGENPVGGALYFNTGSGKGIQIGAHQFY